MYKDKAIQHVREVCNRPDNYLALEHWLRGIHQSRKDKIGMSDPYCYATSIDGELMKEVGGTGSFDYELIGQRYDLDKDGENQSEEFYKAYCEIVGV